MTDKVITFPGKMRATAEELKQPNCMKVLTASVGIMADAMTRMREAGATPAQIEWITRHAVFIDCAMLGGSTEELADILFESDTARKVGAP